MSRRAPDVTLAKPAPMCACPRPMAHYVVPESTPECLKCGREVDTPHDRGHLVRALRGAGADLARAEALIGAT